MLSSIRFLYKESQREREMFSVATPKIKRKEQQHYGARPRILPHARKNPVFWWHRKCRHLWKRHGALEGNFLHQHISCVYSFLFFLYLFFTSMSFVVLVVVVVHIAVAVVVVFLLFCLGHMAPITISIIENNGLISLSLSLSLSLSPPLSLSLSLSSLVAT